MSKLLPIPATDPRSQLKGIGVHPLAGNYFIGQRLSTVSGFIVGEAGPGYVVVQWFNDDGTVSLERQLFSVKSLTDYDMYDDFESFQIGMSKKQKTLDAYLARVRGEKR